MLWFGVTELFENSVGDVQDCLILSGLDAAKYDLPGSSSSLRGWYAHPQGLSPATPICITIILALLSDFHFPGPNRGIPGSHLGPSLLMF